MRVRCQSSVEFCHQILGSLHFTVDGFCKLSSLKPTKEGGYIQISWGGANKFCVLQELVLWSQGVSFKDAGDQCSHLCGRPRCLEHVCKESVAKNNQRKGCVVWWDCPHCELKILICQHNPPCIKYAPGFASWDDFLQNGIHK